MVAEGRKLRVPSMDFPIVVRPFRERLPQQVYPFVAFAERTGDITQKGEERLGGISTSNSPYQDQAHYYQNPEDQSCQIEEALY